MAHIPSRSWRRIPRNRTPSAILTEKNLHGFAQLLREILAGYRWALCKNLSTASKAKVLILLGAGNKGYYGLRHGSRRSRKCHGRRSKARFSVRRQWTRAESPCSRIECQRVVKRAPLLGI